MTLIQLFRKYKEKDFFIFKTAQKVFPDNNINTYISMIEILDIVNNQIENSFNKYNRDLCFHNEIISLDMMVREYKTNIFIEDPFKNINGWLYYDIDDNLIISNPLHIILLHILYRLSLEDINQLKLKII